MHAFHPKHSLGISALLALLAIVYALGVAYSFLGWAGVQSVPATWHRDALPLYGVVYAVGAASAVGIFFWKRWGVYGLGAAWAAMAYLNALYPTPFNLDLTVVGTLLLVAFFLYLRREWHLYE